MAETEDADILETTVRLLLENREIEARAELLKLSHGDPVEGPIVGVKISAQRPSCEPRPPTDPSLLAPVLQQDRWRCRYCGRKLVAAGVIELIGAMCPGQFPFPPGHHMPVGRTHPAAIRVYPAVDHVRAGSQGGDWRNQANLVAACTPCNELKSDRPGWEPTPRVEGAWKGLTEYYRSLAERAGKVRPYHARWLRALGM
jgi:hypothetical protein